MRSAACRTFSPARTTVPDEDNEVEEHDDDENMEDDEPIASMKLEEFVPDDYDEETAIA
jgi:hypothetical protein